MRRIVAIGGLLAAACFLVGVGYLALPKATRPPLGPDPRRAADLPGDAVPARLADASPAAIVRALYDATSPSCRRTETPEFGPLATAGTLTRCVDRPRGSKPCITIVAQPGGDATPRIVRRLCT